MTFDFLQAAEDTANATTYTFSSQNLGAADGSRYIIVAIEARAAGASPITISTVTVGGVSASIPVQLSNASSNVSTAGLAIAAVPTGTTGDIVVTFGAGMVRAAIQAYRAVGINSATPADSGSSSATDPTFDLDIPAGGFAIGCAAFGAGTATWTGITEDDDRNTETGMNATSASDEFVAEQTNLTITVNSSSSTAPAGVFASWAPAAAGGFKPYWASRRSQIIGGGIA